MKADNPYVGPQPFEREDVGRFFGRQRDARDLASLVIAHRVVLLYSASGAGKSSLVNAGLVPVLDRKGFDVLPTVRVGLVTASSHANVFAATLAAQVGGTDGSIASVLQARGRAVDEEGEPAPRALVIDQFEELFTTHPELWSQRPGLFEALHEALEADERLRILLVMREEYLAQLEPYAALVPGALRIRLRLERLERASALEGVVRPLEGTGRRFAPGVAEALVDDLLTLHVETGGRTIEVPGEFVEPVHLQVVCTRLWAELPADVIAIGPEHARALADLDTVLASFYDEAVAAAEAQAGVSERRLRRWVRDELITPGGTRSTVYRGQDETAGLPNVVVAALEESRLVRAEQRAGALWYELTHDRLIEPIRASNRSFEAVRARRLRRDGLIALPIAASLLVGIGIAVASLVGVRAGSRPSETEQSALAAGEALELARRFAPVLRYDSTELFVPVPRSAYVSRTQLKLQNIRLATLLSSTPTVDTLPTNVGSCVSPCFIYLDVRGVEPDPPRHSERFYAGIQNAVLRSGIRPTVYYRVTRYVRSGEYAIQYWFLYFFRHRLSEHESDWQQLVVRLDEDAEPRGVFYSAFGGGGALEWTQVETLDGHPVAYPSRGSHVNYARPGRRGVHRVRRGCVQIVTTTSCSGRRVLVDFSDGRGRELKLGDYALSELTGPVFPGFYGSGNYVTPTERPDLLTEPRVRVEWRDPLAWARG